MHGGGREMNQRSQIRYGQGGGRDSEDDCRIRPSGASETLVDDLLRAFVVSCLGHQTTIYNARNSWPVHLDTSLPTARFAYPHHL